MEITIFDYNGNSTNCLIRPLSQVASISLVVVSGDEVLQVHYKDNETEDFDSSRDRCVDYFDGGYTVYDDGINLLGNEDWLSSCNSYDRMDVAYGM